MNRIATKLWFPSVLFFGVVLWLSGYSFGDEVMVGFSKVDITPTKPLRLSGYARRTVPFEGKDEQLFVRAMVMKSRNGELNALVSIEAIGFTAEFSKLILKQVESLGFSRERLAVCATHCHSAPHLSPGLNNLFQPPISSEQQVDSEAYTARLIEKAALSIKKALDNLQPARISFAQGKVGFARNRRVIKNGIWKNFGENPNGPVDHSLPVLRITNLDGDKTLGIVFNYACHCTTFGNKYNRLNGDWAGYAQKYLEENFEGATALCTIGCGADANPQRDENKELELAKSQGKMISTEVIKLFEKSKWKPIQSPLVASYGFAGLPIDRPGKEELKQGIEDSSPHVRSHAQSMLQTWERMGRLPETYPMPIQVWRFGDEFAMVFLGGEVVAEYALRIKKEIAAKNSVEEDQIWVSAYANDIFGYVASERMRSEGGYEVDFSMIYYLLPGRWSTGTEDLILARVHELFASKAIAEPKSVEEAEQTFALPDGFEISAIVSEPLVEDPINFAVDSKGRLWVVEMGDYPKGAPGKTGSRTANPKKELWDGEPGGRVKILTDSNGDGVYDSFSVFLDGLIFPTGVFPWRDGAIISGAPDIVYAADTDADGVADTQEVLYSGFKEANPQHRVNGFEYGLDGWLYLSGGTNNREITCVKTGEKVRLDGRDVRIHPQTGRAEAVSGDTQYGRCRDEFNRWFGNTNSEPLFQMVLEDRYVERNRFIESPPAKHYMTNPILNPPVYPTSRTLDRFNDLHTLNRFSSACAPLVFRNSSLGSELQNSALICEPVHNLISRVKLNEQSVAVSGERFESELNSEFLSSSDNWFRPVRQITGPDGGLWICDMYRLVIEHPEWIPESWQSSLDLYAGSNMGRIYRVTKTGQVLDEPIDFTVLGNKTIVEKMRSPNGWIRDMAQQILVRRDAKGKIAPAHEEALAKIAMDVSLDSRVRIQSIWACSLISENVLRLDDFSAEKNSMLVANAIRAIGSGSNLAAIDFTTFKTYESSLVRFEIALAASNSADAKLKILEQLLLEDSSDRWVRAAVLSASAGVSDTLLKSLLVSIQANSSETSFRSFRMDQRPCEYFDG